MKRLLVFVMESLELCIYMTQSITELFNSIHY